MDSFSGSEKLFLLGLARQSIACCINSGKIDNGKIVKPESVPESLSANGASFVTLTKHGALRGCVGSLVAYRPLYADVIENSVAAASRDPRFPPVKKDELGDIRIEISVVGRASEIKYSHARELLDKISEKDGLIISHSGRTATFLPQVWSHIHEKEEFLSQLCAKAGLDPDFWKTGKLKVQKYSVVSFEEKEFNYSPTIK